MGQVLHGVVVRCSEREVRAIFATIDSGIPLRLVRLDGDVFGIYARRRAEDYSAEPKRASAQLGRIPEELQRVAAQSSQAAGAALFYWYDSRVGSWDQLYEHGQMTRECKPDDGFRNVWGKSDPLEAIGASRSLHRVVEEVFLYDTREPLAVKNPGWTGAERQ